MRREPAVVVFAGVDGVLIDRATGEFRGSVGNAIHLMLSRDIPLVLCAGRTRAEIERVYQELGTSHPFVCESGAAVFVPNGYFGFDVPYARDVAGYRAIEFGRPYATVVDQLHRAADRVGAEVVGFNDLSVEEVAEDCGLTLLQARLAKLREYDEPFRIVRGTERVRQRLFNALRAVHLGCVNEGRYDRVGAPIDPGIGANWLLSWYRSALGRVVTIGLGSRLTDVPLLRRVDIPLIVPSEDAAVTARVVASLGGAYTASAGRDGEWFCDFAEILARAGDEDTSQWNRCGFSADA